MELGRLPRPPPKTEPVLRSFRGLGCVAPASLLHPRYCRLLGSLARAWDHVFLCSLIESRMQGKDEIFTNPQIL